MDKRFKLKLKFPRVFPMIQFCRPKHSSKIPAVVPSIYRVSPLNCKVRDIGYLNVVLPGPPPSTPENLTVKPRVSSSATTAVDCGCNGGRSWGRGDFSYSSMEFSPEHDVNAASHLVTDKYYTSKKKYSNEKRRRRPTAKAKSRLASSEGSNHWFSSGEDENEESETPIYSSRNFSTDFSAVLETISEVSDKQSNKNKGSNNNKKVRKLKRSVSKTWKETGEINGKIKSVFQPMRVCKRQGMVKESMAVVKKSEDPYEDFKKSMMEMIMEKQIFEAKELEELLHCFLTLNNSHYQGVIVEAFSEIWKLVFSDTPSTSSEFYCLADKSQMDQMCNLKT